MTSERTAAELEKWRCLAEVGALWGRLDEFDSLEELLQRALETFVSVMEADKGTVLERVAGGLELRSRLAYGWSETFIDEVSFSMPPKIAEGLALFSPDPIVVSDFASDERFQLRKALSEEGVRSGIAVAIPGEPRNDGVLCAYFDAPRELCEEQREFAASYCQALSTEIRRLREVYVAPSLQEAPSIRTTHPEWRSTIDALETPVIVVSFAGKILRVNAAAQRIAGRPYDRILGRTMRDIGTGEPWRIAARLIGVVRKARSATSRQATDELSSRTWEVAAKRFLSESRDERIMVVCRDVTEMVELQASLRRSETMSAMGAIVAGVAHEVRNPLFSISATLDAFEARVADSGPYERYTRVLRDEVTRMSTLMSELFDYGRPQRPTLLMSHIDGALLSAVEESRSDASARGVQLDVSIEEGLDPLLMDEGRVQRAFLNVIVNAIQHSPASGTVWISVQRIEERRKAWIECSVHDEGDGFRADDLPRALEPFFSRRRGGTGLGLPVVYRIMEQHNGTVMVTNHPDSGAVVTMRFPAE